MQSLQSPHLFLREYRVLSKRVANRSTVCTPVKGSPVTLHRKCILRAHSQTQRTRSVPKRPQKVFPVLLEGRVHTEHYKCHLVPPASVPRLLVFIDWNFIFLCSQEMALFFLNIHTLPSYDSSSSPSRAESGASYFLQCPVSSGFAPQ